MTHSRIASLTLLAGFLSAEAATAGLSVLSDQVVDSRGDVVTLSLASEPILIAGGILAESTGSITVSLTAPFLISMPRCGGDQSATLAFSGGTLTQRSDVPDFSVELGSALKVNAEANESSLQLRDALLLFAQGAKNTPGQLITVSHQVAISQLPVFKNQTCPPSFARNSNATQAKRPEPAVLVDETASFSAEFDRALARRAVSDINAVRVVVSGSTKEDEQDLAQMLHEIANVCQRRGVLCVLRAASSTRALLGLPEVVAALTGHEDHLILELPLRDVRAAGLSAALVALRSSGLSHLVLITQQDSTELSPPIHLADDPYQTLAMGSETSNKHLTVARSSDVPRFALPAAPQQLLGNEIRGPIMHAQDGSAFMRTPGHLVLFHRGGTLAHAVPLTTQGLTVVAKVVLATPTNEDWVRPIVSQGNPSGNLFIAVTPNRTGKGRLAWVILESQVNGKPARATIKMLVSQDP